MEKKLKILIKVVEVGSFTKSAQILYTSQPSISRDIKSLEEKYKIKIFESSKKVLLLTEEGKILYNYACQLEALEEELVGKLTTLKKEVSGKICIGASYTYGEWVLPDVVSYLTIKYPKLQVDVYLQNSFDIIEALKNKQFDIGFIEKYFNEDDIIIEPIKTDQMVLIAKNEKSLLERNNETFFIREPHSGTRFYQEKALHDLELHPKQTVINNTNIIKYLVSKGLGFSVLSKLTVQKESQEFYMKDLGITRSFYMVTNANKYRDYRVEKTIETIKDMYV